jgi:hypothetical protein
VQYVLDAPLPSREIPFVVVSNSAGADDWLTISIDGEEVWRHALSDFVVGDTYFARLPEGLDVDPPFQLTYFLHSAGESGSEVFFPEEWEDPNLDTDSDGVLEELDNCPTVANPDQVDADGNEVGDACESLPTVQAQVIGTQGLNGWYTSDVTVSWTVGSQSAPVLSTSGCGPAIIANDTSGQALTCTASSAAGSTSASVVVRRDTLAPTIAVSAPSSGASIPVGTNVPANYSCSDQTSGVSQCIGSAPNGQAIDAASAGPKTFTVTSIDQAGNSATTVTSYDATSLTDATPPTIRPVIQGSLGSDNWYTSDIALAWEVQDSESGISGRTGCEARVVRSDTPGIEFTCQATSAGGTTTQSVILKRDATPPTVLILNPNTLFSYPRNIRLPALYACIDLQSRTDECSGPMAVGSPINTGSPGSKQFTVVARDRAGNRQARTVTYVVR